MAELDELVRGILIFGLIQIYFKELLMLITRQILLETAQ